MPSFRIGVGFTHAGSFAGMVVQLVQISMAVLVVRVYQSVSLSRTTNLLTRRTFEMMNTAYCAGDALHSRWTSRAARSLVQVTKALVP